MNAPTQTGSRAASTVQFKPSQHERNEWARLAQAAYKVGNNAVGHRFSHFASLPMDATIPIGVFDSLQGTYREWLIWNALPLEVAK